jgi:hypothetical protein
MILVPGEPSQLSTALSICRDRGRVVLTSRAHVKQDVNLYPDAHRRGLRIVGVDPTDVSGADTTSGGPLARIRDLLIAGRLCGS